MKDLAERFLSETERRRVQAAVEEAEKRTSGEIVPMVVSASYTYPMADVIGAASFALPLAVALTHLIGVLYWIGGQNLWLFLGCFGLLFPVLHAVIGRWPALKRLFVSNREMEEEVEEAAVNRFFLEGLHRTRDESGVLLFISVFEHRVWVLADRGIHAKVEAGQWDEAVRTVVEGIRLQRQADAVCKAVGMIGAVLAAHFPRKPDDSDELRNLIVER
jgi:putative membrane protein